MPNETNHLLNLINITSPCSADWDSMTGNDQVRFCRHCDLTVRNLSEMTPKEAMRLVLHSGGRLCVRYRRGPDGTIQTSGLLPKRLHQIKRRASRIAAGAFSAALSLSPAAAQTSSPSRDALMRGVEIASLREANRSGRLDTPGSTLSGHVLDPQGAAVPGARVTLVNAYTGLEQTVTSGDDGGYQFQSLEAGFYTLKAERTGFKTTVIDNITLDGKGGATINPALEINQIELMGDVAIREPSDPLVKAALNNDLAAVKELLSAGVSANAMDELYQTSALSLAVSKGNLEMVELLLWYGADVNLKNDQGQTALMILGTSSTPEVVRALIEAGAKVDLQDEDGETALMSVAIVDNTEVLRALLDAGAAVNAKNKKGLTALMIAAGRGVIGNVRALIAAGADIYARDEAGSTALTYARENDHPDVAELLRAYGAIEYGPPR